MDAYQCRVYYWECIREGWDHWEAVRFTILAA